MANREGVRLECGEGNWGVVRGLGLVWPLHRPSGGVEGGDGRWTAHSFVGACPLASLVPSMQGRYLFYSHGRRRPYHVRGVGVVEREAGIGRVRGALLKGCTQSTEAMRPQPNEYASRQN